VVLQFKLGSEEEMELFEDYTDKGDNGEDEYQDEYSIHVDG
jgi:hypothetical protein